MRVYLGLVIGLLGPVLSFGMIAFMLRTGPRGWLVVAGILAVLGFAVQWDVGRRRKAAEIPMESEPAADGSIPSSAMWGENLASVARLGGPRIATAIGQDLLGAAGATLALAAVAVIVVLAGHISIRPLSGWVMPGGAPNTAAVSVPRGVAVDTAGNLYVSDDLNDRIEKLSPSGALLASWGQRGTGAGELSWPAGVAVDHRGRVYVADAANGRVQVFSARGTLTGMWGRGILSYPMGIALDSQGHLWVADPGASRVGEFSSTGRLLGIWGGTKSFATPEGIAVGPHGTIYLLDTGNNQVEIFSPRLRHLATWSGLARLPGAALAQPAAVTVDHAGNVYVADAGNHRIDKLAPNGKVVAIWGRYGTGVGNLNAPHGLAVNAQGMLYVADTWNHRVVELLPGGQQLQAFPLASGPRTGQAAAVVESQLCGPACPAALRARPLERAPVAPHSRQPPLLAWFHVFVP
jgi:DNA-binding beta-propeller fold protein YncE